MQPYRTTLINIGFKIIILVKSNSRDPHRVTMTAIAVNVVLLFLFFIFLKLLCFFLEIVYTLFTFSFTRECEWRIFSVIVYLLWYIFLFLVLLAYPSIMLYQLIIYIHWYVFFP
ncbi:hypothetical protein Lalb_Chr18g0044431 [Lupinus albus]|uniref:Uncharacterized protein n=1 Tax=Lupinus albus TaxID=3870 RepID=A0A6A4NIS7_LUPAL|nr:hypothetical protein Lalb_Chr18g0044431 [Lupinus albus]